MIQQRRTPTQPSTDAVHQSASSEQTIPSTGSPVSPDPFDELFNRYYDQAARFAYLAGAGDLTVARDIATDALARVWEKWRRGTVAEFWPYLRAAIVNDIRSRSRKRSVADRYAHTHPFEGSSASADAQFDERHTLESALAQLPPRQRLALVLRYFEDMSTEQTAVIMRCSVGTAKSTTSRALASLRELMKDGTDAQ